MDEIVKQAMAKWPNVPHCHGWLALDARGAWRMRDEQAQAMGLPGDKIANAALLGFINRNYTHDNHGRWYFQNGPQRVYVDLESTPFIARTDPVQGFLLHTGEPLQTVDSAWLTETGRLLLQGTGRVALVDDRDMAQCIAAFRLNETTVGDEQLMAWLAAPHVGLQRLTFSLPTRAVPVQRIEEDKMPAHFGFIRQPRLDGD